MDARQQGNDPAIRAYGAGPGGSEGGSGGPSSPRGMIFGLGALVAVVAVVLVVVLGADSEDADGAATTSTSTTTSSADPTVAPVDDGPLVMTRTPWWIAAWYAPGLDPGQPITMPGWEHVDTMPIAAHLPTAAAWTGREIFVWVSTPLAELFGQMPMARGLLYDPVEGSWQPTSMSMHLPSCLPTNPWLYVVGGDVVVFQDTAAPGCSLAMTYHPETNTWSELPDAFMESDLMSSRSLVSTGDLLVSTWGGRAIEWETGQVIDIPPVSDLGRPIRGLPVWDGERVIVLGQSDVFTWRPGDDAWEIIEGPGALEGNAGAMATSDGLLVADRAEGAVFLSDGAWNPAPGLFWNEWCVVEFEATSVPLARVCSGLFAWDGVSGQWVPVPPPAFAYQDEGVVVDAGGEVYAIGIHIRRLALDRAQDGSISAPSTIAVGLGALLDLPDGFEFAEALGPSPRPAISPPEGAASPGPIGIALTRDGVTCDIREYPEARTGSRVWLNFPDRTTVTITRPGLRDLTALLATNPDGVAFAALPNGFVPRSAAGGALPVVIGCESNDAEASRSVAVDLIHSLWHPSRRPSTGPQATRASAEPTSHGRPPTGPTCTSGSSTSPASVGRHPLRLTFSSA